MAEATTNLRPTQQVRARALIIPREHGAWGLLLIPLLSGAATGIAASHRILPLVLFTVAVLALFWLRTPFESLLGSSPMSAHTQSERRTAMLACCSLAAVALICLAALVWHGQHRGLFWFGLVAVLIFGAQTGLRKLGRNLRMHAELVGALALTCAAPAAYYVATGQLDFRAWGLWAANWIFAGNQIHFVHLRIHAARANSFSEKLAQGPWFFANQLLMIPVLVAAALAHLLPFLVPLAFVPVLIRGVYWFVRKPAPLQIKKLGWSEIKQGVLFGILLTIFFIIR
jgi:hypothetical protein